MRWVDSEIERLVRAGRGAVIRPGTRGLLPALVMAAALALVAITPALGGGPEMLQFASAEPAPQEATTSIERSLRVERFFGETSRVLAGRPRVIFDRPLAGGRAVVVAAPVRGGGFCWVADAVSSRGGASSTVECLTRARAGRIGVGVLADSGGFLVDGKQVETGARQLLGYVALPETARLQARYEDGTAQEIPFTWVSHPIRVGFFAFDPPASHRAGKGGRIVEVAALDARGRRIARQAFTYATAATEAFDRRWNIPSCCNQTRLFPLAADITRVTKVTFPGLPTWAPTILVAPAGKDGFCWAVVNRHVEISRPTYEVPPTREGVLGGCEPTAGTNFGWGIGASIPPFVIRGAPDGNGGPTAVWLFGSVETRVARLELSFQDGTRAKTIPRSRLVAYVIPRAHWAPGRRLKTVILKDAAGREVRRVAFDLKHHGYPCEKPVDFGGGFSYCR